MSTVRPQLKIAVRSALPGGPDVNEIARLCADLGWDEWDARSVRRAIGTHYGFGLVAEVNGVLVGWLAYELGSRALEVIAVGVYRPWRQLGVGRALLAEVVSRARRSPAKTVGRADVDEDDLALQKFLRACGWKAVRVLTDDAGAVGYRFEVQ